MRDLELVKKLLDKHLAKHQTFITGAQTAERYYRNKGDILDNGAAAIDAINRYLAMVGSNPLRSADNRVPLNWHRIIVDQKIGYLFSYPPQFDLENADMEKLLGDEYEKKIKRLGLDASNTGRAWIHYWIDASGQKQYAVVDPQQIIAIYNDADITRPLKLLIRTYSSTDDQGAEYTRYEVWDDQEVSYFYHKDAESNDKLQFEMLPNSTLQKTMANPFGVIPFIEFSNNEFQTSDLDMYKAIIDCLDKVYSGFANDIDDIQEILWVLRGYNGEDAGFELDDDGEPIKKPFDVLQELKAKKFVKMDADGGIDAVTGEIPHEARTKFIELLEKQLYISAMAVDPHPQSAGNQSGVYIEFLYGLLELKAGLMETEFRAALNKLIRALTGIAPDAKIVQTWTRNKPVNDVELAGIINSTPPTVMSDETKTKEHPLVDDWKDERTKIEQEQKSRYEEEMALFASQDKGDDSE